MRDGYTNSGASSHLRYWLDSDFSWRLHEKHTMHIAAVIYTESRTYEICLCCDAFDPDLINAGEERQEPGRATDELEAISS